MKVNKTVWGVLGIAGGALLISPGERASAQSASAQAMLEEVVVTARRREENLQDLPLSIAAISADAMEAQGIYSVEDVGDFIPNVTLTQSDRANNTRIVIRGIGGGHPDPVFPFGSGMYIDGHYIPNSLGGYMTTMDIDRVEILRGPQGTLFGKNVTGGPGQHRHRQAGAGIHLQHHATGGGSWPAGCARHGQLPDQRQRLCPIGRRERVHGRLLP